MNPYFETDAQPMEPRFKYFYSYSVYKSDSPIRVMFGHGETESNATLSFSEVIPRIKKSIEDENPTPIDWDSLAFHLIAFNPLPY
jgi:hypothetical protein